MKIGILDPLNAAMRATGLILFRPFGVRKWLAIALPVWLIMIGQGMGTEYMQPAIWVGQWIGWEKIGNWIMAHMVLFDVYLFLGMLVAFAIYLAYRWLNALGELGLISRMLERESSMKQALGRHKRRAWTLCWFMVKWEFVVFNCGALLVLSCAALATPDVVHSWPGLKAHFFDLAVDPSLFFNEYNYTGWSWAALIALAPTCILFLLVKMVLSICLEQLTIPIIYHTDMKPWQAFRHTLTHVVFPNLKPFCIYGLLVLVTVVAIGIGATIATYVAIVVTLGIAWGLDLMPVLSNLPLYIVAVITLPLVVFNRAFSLTFLAQFEERFKIDWNWAAMRGGFPVEINQAVAPTPPSAGSGSVGS